MGVASRLKPLTPIKIQKRMAHSLLGRRRFCLPLIEVAQCSGTLYYNSVTQTLKYKKKTFTKLEIYTSTNYRKKAYEHLKMYCNNNSIIKNNRGNNWSHILRSVAYIVL